VTQTASVANGCSSVTKNRLQPAKYCIATGRLGPQDRESGLAEKTAIGGLLLRIPNPLPLLFSMNPESRFSLVPGTPAPLPSSLLADRGTRANTRPATALDLATAARAWRHLSKHRYLTRRRAPESPRKSAPRRSRSRVCNPNRHRHFVHEAKGEDRHPQRTAAPLIADFRLPTHD